jgi:hypothetical protein
MFRKSSKEPQFDLLGSVPSLLSTQAIRKYNDKNHWHNQFRLEVVDRIDETIYKVLFSDTMGAPNASIRLLIGMMILKEAFGWSDSQLFEQCQFNLLIRGALGMINLNDPVPAESTYYLFRKRVYEYHRQKGEDLLEKTFSQITHEQVKQFEVNGREIRMDTKLIGSNIAYYSRYETIHQTLYGFYKTLDKKSKYRIPYSVRKQLEMLMNEEPGKIVYRSTKEEILSRSQQVGLLIHKLLEVYKDQVSEAFRLLQRVFDEQYKIVDKQQIQLRLKEEISPESIQSPHDPDCGFSHKNGKWVKGYNVNVTESCSDENLNLITSVIVDRANLTENKFIQQAIDSTIKVTGQAVEKIYLDGAYQSPDNDEFCKDIDMVYTGLQGFEPRFDLEMTPKGLMVTDKQTGEQMPATLAKKRKETSEDLWFLKKPERTYYFSQQAIRAAELRKIMKNRPVEDRHKRNNVEASIFQLSLHLRNNKSKYRRQFKLQIWTYCRCLWINLVRIVNFILHTCTRTSKTMKMLANIGFLFNKSIISHNYQLRLSTIFVINLIIISIAFF